MRLSHVGFKHYKSMGDVQVDLHPNITVLVGPNAAGKSNFVDGLRFVRDAVVDSLDHAVVGQRGGVSRIRPSHWALAQCESGFALKFEVRIDDIATQPNGVQLSKADAEAVYEFSISTSERGAMTVAHEQGSRPVRLDTDFAAAVSNGVSRDTFLRYPSGLMEAGPAIAAPYQKIDTDRLGVSEWDLTSSLFDSPSILGALSAWRFSQLHPQSMRQLLTPDATNILREDGSNWASVIRSLRRSPSGREVLGRIDDMMRVVLPDFETVSVSTVGAYLVPTFKFARPKGTPRTFDPVQLSDGTLRIYGLLLALYQRPAPTLIVIEEPELNVHPGVLPMLCEALQEVSELSQIIVTTHSPHMVDQFQAENIRVVSMKDSETRIGPVKASQMNAVKKGLMTLSEFMSAEGLQAEGA